MTLRDTLSLSFRTVRSNKLRTGITVAIIALGITALIGINTAIVAIKQKFLESFSSMGATGFTIRYQEPRRFFHNDEVKKEKKGEKKEKKSNQGKPVTQRQAEEFKAAYQFPAQVSANIMGDRSAIVSYGNQKTNPNVWLVGGDENYASLNGFAVFYGRDLNALDIETGRNVCLVGKDIATRFFGENLDRPIDRIIGINNIPFRIIGTLGPKGSTFGRSLDNLIIISYSNARRFFNNSPNASFNIQVKVPDIKLMDGAIGEATSVFRPIRKLTVTESDNFLIDKSDSFAELLIKNLSAITIAALMIGVITLVGAAIPAYTDKMSRYHLQDLNERIDRVLNPR